MRRILSFHGFFIVFWIWIGFSCAYRRGIPPIENNPSKSLRPTGAHNPCESNRISVKEQIRCIRAIRVSLNACGRRIAMSTRKLKYQWIKIWGKWIMIYFSCFVYWCFISPSMLKSLRALPPRLKNETRIARMRRILSFHGFFIVFWIWIGFSCAYRRGISPFTMPAEGPKS